MTGKFICAEASCRRYDMAVDEDVAEALEYKCPACHAPLAEQESGLSPLEEQIIGTYPSLIAIPFARLHEKREVESKQRLLVETTTNLFKYLALVVETEYLVGDHVLPELTTIIENDLSANIPLSAWPMFLANAIPALEDKKHEFFVAELPDYFRRMDEFKGNRPSLHERVGLHDQGYWDEHGDFVKQNETVGRFNALITYRNNWAHKPNLPEAQAQEEFEHYYQILLECLEPMAWCVQYPIYKHEQSQVHLLMGTSPVAEGPSPATGAQDGNLYLGHPRDQPPLQLVPLFIVPRDFLPEPNADLFFYDAYTGKRLVYVSPEGHRENIEGTVERWRQLIQGKRLLWPRLGKSALDAVEIFRRGREETGRTRDALRGIGKVIKGLYYSRKEMLVPYYSMADDLEPFRKLDRQIRRVIGGIFRRQNLKMEGDFRVESAHAWAWKYKRGYEKAMAAAQKKFAARADAG